MLRNYSNKPERNIRIAGEIQKLFSSIMHFEIKDPRVLALSISQIQVTKDLRLAKIFFVIENDSFSVEDCLKGLEASKGYLKKSISRSLNLKYTPELKFYYDETIGVQEKLKEIFGEDDAD